MQDRTKIILTLLLPVQILCIKIIALFPEWVEQYYSTGIYVYIGKTLRFLFGWIPFSIGDIGYTLLILLLIRFVIQILFRRPRQWKNIGLTIGATLSIAYAVFHILWGINYYRVPLHEQLGLTDEYTETELVHVCHQLIEATNALHQTLEPIDSLPVKMPYTKQEVFDKTVIAYAQAQEILPSLAYTPKSIKTSLLSVPLTYMGFSGYLNPFTNEAQVNGLILNYKAPTTSCHEEAHQLGFAKENEANFIAALTTIHCDDLYFKYSGLTFALKFCLNNLYQSNEQKALCLIEEEMRPGILKNYEAVHEFWESYENPLEPIFKSTYDQYLKANEQPGGIATYSYVTALLVNYYTKYPIL